ncbi:hypothetical protein [Nitratireductor sp.]|uniref:hypothetical protein n=1 Tax=Nitratireductor sp. TaxID=1872084 RepID=UPI00260A806C|nr:hypothetical protein [Nitratireductor sp.]MCV0380542.1 hypothetical protein [Nitratireductor sp.]
MTHYGTCPTVDLGLKDSTAAINFALDRLQDWETKEFLKEWRQGKDLTPWIDAWREDQEDAPASTDQ